MLLLRKQWLLGGMLHLYRLATPSLSRSAQVQPGTQVLGVKHEGNQVVGLDDEVKLLLDFVTVILQAGSLRRFIDVEGISNGGLVTLPQV